MLSSPIILELPPSIQLTDDQFFELCEINGNLCLERDLKTGEIWIMVPVGGETGNRNLSLLVSSEWGLNGMERELVLTRVRVFGLRGQCESRYLPMQLGCVAIAGIPSRRNSRKNFPPLCPDFVVELRSPSDTLESLRNKMREWMRLGVQLGWLIDRVGRKVYVYRADGSEDCLDNPATVSGDPLPPGFILELGEIW
jgi:Uma2 family endonuclease